MEKQPLQAGDAPSLNFDFQPSIRVISGADTMAELGRHVRELGCTRVLLVTDPGVEAAGHIKPAKASLDRAMVTYEVYNDVSENPSSLQVSRGAAFARACGRINGIVALGGGSAMDCAKGINMLLTNGGRMEDYYGHGKLGLPTLPSIGIPTTAGTGSEAQSFALISREKDGAKMACGDIKARFKLVILDPTLVATAPREVRALAGLDAMAHAVESQVSSKANILSRSFSFRAWQLLDRHFQASLAPGAPIEDLQAMLVGAYLAGMAIENAMLGGAHACANPLTAQYGTPHGQAVAVMLPHIVAFNEEVASPGYHELASILTGQVARTPTQLLIERLQQHIDVAEIPNKLRMLGISAQDLPALAQHATTQWTGQFNPRPLTQHDFLQIFTNAW